jgi:hypothetical protein
MLAKIASLARGGPRGLPTRALRIRPWRAVAHRVRRAQAIALVGLANVAIFAAARAYPQTVKWRRERKLNHDTTYCFCITMILPALRATP